MRQHLVDEIAHPSRDGQRVHALGQFLKPLVGRTESSVGRDDLGPRAEEFLVAASRDLAARPVGAWVRLKITCAITPQGTDAWDPTVTAPGKTPRRFAKLPITSPDGKRPDWLGFFSMARKATTIALDDVVLDTDDPAAKE